MPPSARHKLKALAYAGIALFAALFFLGLGVLLMIIGNSGADMPRPSATASLWRSIASGAPDMSQPWTPPPPPHHHHPPTLYTLEDALLETDVVARVRLLGVEEEIRSPGANEAYGAYMEFKFEVLEYLKGGYGISPIWGYVYLDQAEGATEEEARWKSKYFWQRRSSQWDDREAVVLMADIDKQNRKDHFGLGVFSPYRGESYRLIGRKKWLPAASTGGISGASDERTFLLDYPRSGIAGDSSDGVELVSLAELRQIAALPYAKLHRRVRAQKEDRHTAITPEGLLLATGMHRLSATSALDRAKRSWDPIVRLRWNRADNAPNVLGHRILRRKQSDSEFIELADTPVDATPFYEDTRDIQPETKYIYLLRAYGENGDLADARVTIATVAALEPLDAPTLAPTPTP